jgi:hypothetical protein
LGYACVLVEVDVNSGFPKEIFISRMKGETLSIGVEYPWLPPKCSLCAGFGHVAYHASRNRKRLGFLKGQRIIPGLMFTEKLEKVLLNILMLQSGSL